MARDDFQQPVQVADSQTSRNDLAEHGFGTVIVRLRIEVHLSFEKLLLVANRPTGETPRDLHHVLLRIATMHTEGVQLHQLARIVFVWALIRFPAAIYPPIEIPEHGG